jgi:(2R)-3-sulfolactate dehydrogenase (NADP+)
MTTTTISTRDLEQLMTAALERANTAPANAAATARALTQAEIDGQKGHGLSRVPSYAAQSRSGKVDGNAVPTVTRTRPGSLMVDVRHGFFYPAMDAARAPLVDAARSTGIAAAGFVRSHHAGVIGAHLDQLATAHGLVALMFANTPHAMASAGGKRPVFGTNPIGFAAPRKGREAVVVDMALSAVARGKILTAAQKGEAIPAGWATDDAGQPTTDAKAALKGTLLPLGGAKGSALALMVEVLAVALTGASLSAHASSFFDGDGAPPSVGQLLIVIDPAAFGGADVFAERFEALAALIESDAGARLPGTRRIKLREAAKGGIAVDTKLLDEVRALAGAGK